MSKKITPIKVSPVVVMKKIIEDYASYKKDGFTEEQIKNLISRSIEFVQVTLVRAQIEKEMKEDSEKIQALSDAVKRNIKDPWALETRITITDDDGYEMDEIRALDAVTNFAKIEKLLAKHRTCCALLERHAIRLSPYTEHRQKVYEILNNMMPTELRRIPSDII